MMGHQALVAQMMAASSAADNVLIFDDITADNMGSDWEGRVPPIGAIVWAKGAETGFKMLSAAGSFSTYPGFDILNSAGFMRGTSFNSDVEEYSQYYADSALADNYRATIGNLSDHSRTDGTDYAWNEWLLNCDSPYTGDNQIHLSFEQAPTLTTRDLVITAVKDSVPTQLHSSKLDCFNGLLADSIEVERSGDHLKVTVNGTLRIDDDYPGQLPDASLHQRLMCIAHGRKTRKAAMTYLKVEGL